MDKKIETILIVGNSTSKYDELCNILSDDYKLVSAATGAEAISYLNNSPLNPDIILASYQMPVINGLELLEAIKDSPIFKKIPFILIFDEEDDNAITSAIAAGVDEVLVRPLLGAIVKKRIRNCIKLYPVLHYKNVMEKVVENEVDNSIKEIGVCTCPVCRNDLICLSLNLLPTKYVNTDKGELYSRVDKLSNTFRTKVLAAIVTAAETVKTHPRHTKTTY